MATTSGCQKPKGVDLTRDAIVVGRIIDQDKLPVPGAVVYENPARTAVSDPQGGFTLPVAAGTADLHIQAVGYRPLTVRVHAAPGAREYVTKDGYVRLVLAK